MMRRKIQVMILAACMLLAAGCGSKDLSDSVNNAATSANGSAAPTSESAAGTPSLNVENDTFTFEQLVRQAGAKEADVLTLLGAKEKSDSYATTLFGESVTVVLTSEGDTVSAIKLTFAGTNADSVINAIAEELGMDGERTDNTATWSYQNNTVTLTTDNQNCVVDITKA